MEGGSVKAGSPELTHFAIVSDSSRKRMTDPGWRPTEGVGVSHPLRTIRQLGPARLAPTRSRVTEAPANSLNKRSWLFADNTGLSSQPQSSSVGRLSPVALLAEPLGGFEEPFDRRDLLVPSPNGVDGQHRPRGCEVDKLEAAWELLD